MTWAESLSCQCPEVWTGTTWTVHCEAIGDEDGVFADLEAAAAAGPEPRTWRCPTCHGPIVRAFWEASAAGVPSVHVPGAIDDQAVVRAGYRCRSAPCGWAGWVMWMDHRGGPPDWAS
jgi:hypothetical protein